MSGVYTYYVSGTGTASVKLTGKKYYKVSSGSWKAQSLAKYKNDRVKIHGKYFYVDKNGSMIKTAKTVKSGNYKFTIKADGTCTKTKIETKIPDNSNSGKSDENNTGKTDATIPTHTHQWSPLAEDHTMLKDTNYVKHDAVVENVYKEITPEHKKEIYTTTSVYVCLTCVWKKKPKEGEPWVDLDGDGKWTAQVEGREYFKYFYYSDINGLMDHRNNYPSHGQSTVTPVHLGTTIIPAEYGYVPTTITPEWSECDMNVRCTICNEMMKIHVVRTYDPYSVKCTPEKSGDLVNIYGKKYASVTAGVSYED